MINNNNNKIIFWIAVVGVLLIIGLSTIILVVTHHHQKLQNVFHSKLVESANNCWNEERCDKEEVTLKELMEKEYLSKEDIVDPITKEYLKEETKIIKKDDMITIERKQ